MLFVIDENTSFEIESFDKIDANNRKRRVNMLNGCIKRLHNKCDMILAMGIYSKHRIHEIACLVETIKRLNDNNIPNISFEVRKVLNYMEENNEFI